MVSGAGAASRSRVTLTLPTGLTTFQKHSASAYMGCCSYRSAADFVACSDYYHNMVQEATEETMVKAGLVEKQVTAS
jgi:hypothetical protein